MKQLARLGLLREMTDQARNRIFLAEAVLRAIDEPLPSDLEEGA